MFRIRARAGTSSLTSRLARAAQRGSARVSGMRILAEPIGYERAGVISKVCEAIGTGRQFLFHQLKLQPALNPATDSLLVTTERFSRLPQKARQDIPHRILS